MKIVLNPVLNYAGDSIPEAYLDEEPYPRRICIEIAGFTLIQFSC